MSDVMIPVPRRHEITAGDVIVVKPQSQSQLTTSSNEANDPVVSSEITTVQ